MFNLFKKKEPELTITDRVCISGHAKYRALLERWKKDNRIVVICWFDDSLREAASCFEQLGAGGITLMSNREVSSAQLAGKIPVFAEHYPLRSKELELFSKLQLREVEVYSSLDEPVFQQFGGDKIIRLMEQLGMNEEEHIEHKMVSQAIRNMQEKMEKKILVDQSARSQSEWLQKNYKG